jgi:cellulose biosynthesis protein BcsQ
MFSDLRVRVVAADLDPQANLTALCLDEASIERMYQTDERQTVFGAVKPLHTGVGDIRAPDTQSISQSFSLVPGDIQLYDFEDSLSSQWPRCLNGEEYAFRVTAAFARILQSVGQKWSADVGLIDVGPGFGALNRAALIAADFVVIPVALDLFSVKGLQNVGARLQTWRTEWKERFDRAPDLDFRLPPGDMRPIGYAVSRQTLFAGHTTRFHQGWADRIPAAYRTSVDDKAQDSNMNLGRIKDVRSLQAMAQEARKPVFHLKPADGAIGGHQGAVADAYNDYRELAMRVAQQVGIVLPKVAA